MRERSGGRTRNDALAEALRLIARDDDSTGVPPHIETVVMQAWDARVQHRMAPPRRGRRWIGALAAAACIVLAAALWVTQPTRDTAGARAPRDVEVLRDGAVSPLDPAVTTEVLLQADPASLQRVRLTVQPSALAALGYAFAGPADTEPVNVEVLIGLDGVPRAIRRLEYIPVRD